MIDLNDPSMKDALKLTEDAVQAQAEELEQISFGTCPCGHYGQLFRTGKCAHCYIAELEADVLRLADKVLAIKNNERAAVLLSVDGEQVLLQPGEEIKK